MFDPQHPPPPHAVPSPGGALAAATAQKAGHLGPVQDQVPELVQVHPSHLYEHSCPNTAHDPLGWTAGHAAESARSPPSSLRASVSAPPSAPTFAVLASGLPEAELLLQATTASANARASTERRGLTRLIEIRHVMSPVNSSAGPHGNARFFADLRNTNVPHRAAP